MTPWHRNLVALKFKLSDLTLFSVDLPLWVCSFSLTDEKTPGAEEEPPDEAPPPGTVGYCMRSLPIGAPLPRISRVGDYIRYVPLQFRHCYIDLRIGFQSYQQKFSAKTRSTILRKVRKFDEYSGGKSVWRAFSDKNEILEFHRLARVVSAKTYQERLLDAGIPDNPAFVEKMLLLAERGEVQGYILFDKAEPVAYLYCPIADGAFIYAYLGYDPAYSKYSVGTVLQWLAVERMFEEARVGIFDFTEGQSDHKRLFATHEISCANVMFVRRTPYTSTLLHSHAAMNRLVDRIGLALENSGCRTRLRRFIRRSA